MSEKTGNLYRRTGLRGNGRRAGIGVSHDDYGDESGCRDYDKHQRVRLPHDHVKPEELNGPVICYREEKMEPPIGGVGHA